ncbi:hypothetical protein D7I39_04000 [Allopusillimonas ginsengisoli]|nr:hypothetical protein D7I39_04000 [Allopusillimonas ginsengisoli]
MVMSIADTVLEKLRAVLILIFILGVWLPDQTFAQASGSGAQVDVGAQTDVDGARHTVDAEGVPMLEIKNVGKVHHPAWTALYALSYAGIEVYDSSLGLVKDHDKFEACIRWLMSNLKQDSHGLWVWEYSFNSTYNDVSMRSPWSSAFAQATGIQALLAAYRLDGNKQALDAATRAAVSLMTPISKGGFQFESGADMWFEEIPASADNPSHILNGHMRVLLALKELVDITGEADVKQSLKVGLDTLYRWLPLYDTGYWLRYDLNPKKEELLFRLANPYGFKNLALAIDKIRLVDPDTGKEAVLDVGAPDDAEGPLRIAGTDWSAAEKIDDRSVRRLVPSELDNTPDRVGAPHTYFYFELPAEWKNNLRRNNYNLFIDYLDDHAGNVAVQQRSIAPGIAFKDVRDGDLHLTGENIWRTWMIPVRVNDLGYWVGFTYAEKHSEYLRKIATWDPRFGDWSALAQGYLNLAKNDSPQKIINQPQSEVQSLKNTPVVPLLSLDKKGVVMQHFADSHTKWSKNGTFDPSGGKGTPSYSPYLIAEQLLSGEGLAGAETFGLNVSDIKREPALDWLLNPKNYYNVNGAHIYQYYFDNVYNDIATKAPWPSAFGQAYVLKSLIFAKKQKLRGDLEGNIAAAATAYDVPVEQGGFVSIDKSGLKFYEEVPNRTHVLNAHAVSVPELAAAARLLSDKQIQSYSDQGVQALKDKLYLYDTGYWLRYDQNPKKELLLQLDWHEGKVSPLIHDVLLENPETGSAVRILPGDSGDFDGVSRLSGTDWQAAKQVDGKLVRGFSDGYQVHPEPVNGGTRQNAYMVLALPAQKFDDYFNVPVHKLTIHYKDIAKGRFSINIQSINAGSALKFVPLRGSQWITTGDQEWKKVSFLVRPQDIGWYKGADYQKFEVNQLQRIASLTYDQYFYQYAMRHRYFLETQKKVKW